MIELPAIFKKKRGIEVGLDIGSHATKIIVIDHTKKPGKVIQAEVFNIAGHSPALLEALTNWVKKMSLTGCTVRTSIDDPALRIRKLELPGMPTADMKEAVKWKMRQAIDGAIEDYTVTSSIIEETLSGGNKKILLVGYAIPKKKVEQTKAWIEKTGLRVESIEPQAVSLASLVEELAPSEQKWVAGLLLGAEQSILTINGKGKFYFSRPLLGIKKPSDAEDPVIFFRKLAGEIQTSFDTFSVTFQIEKIDQLLITGGGALLDGLADFLSKNLAIHTQTVQPTALLEWDDAIKTKVSNTETIWSLAFSTALWNS